MPSNIVAYEWPLKGTIHIAYETGDNHIHEMVRAQKGSWRDSDITRVAGGPELEDALLAGSVWSAGHTQQIAYAGSMNADGHIYELVMYQDHPWSVEDIMQQPIGAAPADGFSLVAFDWKTGGTKHLVYTGRDGHLHELSAAIRGLWDYSDLTQTTGAPLVADATPLAAYAWETGKSQHVVYISEDGHLHELTSGLDGQWSHTDLMAVTGAPPAGTNVLAAYAWEAAGMRQVVYTGEDGTIYELVSGQQGAWSFVDITSQTGAPLASGSALAAYAWETGNAKQIVYVAGNRHIYELQMPLQGAWEYTDLTEYLNVPEASQDVIAAHEWTPEFAKHVVYIDTLENPRIHSLLFEHGEQWQHTDVTKATGSQTIV